MIMASVRTIRVRSKEYLQVVEYFVDEGQRRMRVLKAFGENTLLNRLKAKQFESSFNLLKAFKEDVSREDADAATAILDTALVLFGAILGVKIISDLLKRNEHKSK